MPTILTAFGTPRSSFTVAGLRDEVRADLAYTDTTVISDADVDRWAYRAQTRLALESRFYQIEAQVTTVGGQYEYALPSGTISVNEVWVNNERVYPLATDELISDWRVASPGTPARYYLHGQTVLGLLPSPAATGLLVQVFVTAAPPRPASGETYYVPTALEDGILCFCKLRASEKDGYGEGGARINGLRMEWENIWLPAARRMASEFATEEIVAAGSDSFTRTLRPRGIDLVRQINGGIA